MAVPDLFDTGRPVKSRLEMANWLVSENNPLAARVLANRLWAEFFGTGIVETLEDFGSSGALPSHPELLDFLAVRLREDHGWRLKPFLKEIVLSASYRQTNRANPEVIASDPRNRLVGRGPRQRLTGEMIRDQALLVSGLLSDKMYGPPVYPPQPEGIWRNAHSGKQWVNSTGPDRYRRAIYTYVRRTTGFPGLLTFDSPTRELCSPRRIATNTPLQALLTLNDPAHIEFAQAYAARIMDAPGDLEQQLSWAYRQIALAQPAPSVIETLKVLHNEVFKEFELNPAESKKLAPTPTEAALVMVANTLLNSDLALNR